MLLPSALAQTASLEIVAEGLDNPRGIALGAEGAIFVAESGAGGTDCRRIPGFGRACFGLTASVTRISPDGTVTTRVTLPSGAGEDGFGATGASDVAYEDGTFYIAMGGAPPNAAEAPAGRQVVQRLATAKPLERIVDLGNFEAKHDPDGGGVDSNPYAVARVEGGTIVTDAGGNDLILVPDGGRPQLVATFPTQDLDDPDGNTIPAQAVPNTVTVGPDGAWYVGQLTGYPFTVGTSRVWRIEPDARDVACDAAATSGPCTLYADGLTAIIDIAFGTDGKLYVLEIAKNGVLGLESGEPTDEDLVGALLRMDGADTFTEIASEGLVTRRGSRSRSTAMFVTNYGPSRVLGRSWHHPGAVAPQR
jgi:hypothetical protein